MIVWRRLTVITFHSDAQQRPRGANITITTGHYGDRPIAADAEAATAQQPIARHVPLPSRLDSPRRERRRRRSPPNAAPKPITAEQQRADLQHLLGEEHERGTADHRWRRSSGRG